MDLPKLNIYGQYQEHCEAYIVGNRWGLEALRDAINDALSHEKQHTEVFAVDGEGYELVIVLKEGDETKTHDGRTIDLALPYTGKFYHHPFDLVPVDWYRGMFKRSDERQAEDHVMLKALGEVKDHQWKQTAWEYDDNFYQCTNCGLETHQRRGMPAETPEECAKAGLKPCY